MKIVVGLGNFGDKYAYTFHNMGFLAAECLAERLGFRFSKRVCEAQIAKGYIEGEPVIVAKPLTYMNLSGRAVLQLLKRHKASLADLLILFDDIDIAKGDIRVRPKGSAGTHNGMRNVIELVGSGDFARVRIGIGPKPEFVPIADYVLSEVPRSERQTLFDAIGRAADEAEKWLQGQA
ncbi:MAG: aminoacyl-tRNA hydrolase [Clostridiales bacterium]|nr:aminoacyl-tRNA hydrolase [Clostridiales bacterium]